MIEVHIGQNGIRIRGHSGYAAWGSDIVCAGVSALFQTLAESVLALTDDTVEYRILPGEADLRYGNLSEKAKTLIDSFFIGISMLAEEYSEYVRIV